MASVEMLLCGIEMFLTFANDRVEEIDAAKGASHNRVDAVAGSFKSDLSVSSDVGEDFLLAHFDQSQLTVVAVGEEVFEWSAVGFD